MRKSNYKPRRCYQCNNEIESDMEGDWICHKCNIAWRLVRIYTDIGRFLNK